MMKVLSVLVNFGEEQLSYLKEVVEELKSFKKYEVYIVVQSNIPLDIEGIDEVNVVKLEDYQLLPLTCRSVIWKYRNDYELFLYGENDHLFKEHHLDNHIKYSNILPKNRIAGLIQYEFNDLGRYYPAYHLDFDWDFNSVEEHGGKLFAHFSNLHQATFIITKDQLEKLGQAIDFTTLVDEKPSLVSKVVIKFKKLTGIQVTRASSYSVKCKVNTDLYRYGGMKKVICITDFEENLIHHLPNLYIDGDKGRLKLRSDEMRMTDALKRLLN
ncbi:hypothetical protein [Nonlabens ulvanivorans]|uniref:Uncharacterized protein n=2 Tax=Nonlabens ulvanivorans TaxID=906888 RepID=A0ABX5E5I5_NONUL|nr:hypothetical protein [Nonlabens ulvanivorans]PRX14361.1 hypothetical protein LY02_01391 [Nonlabens ulvanivorans]WOI23095.1 hypothetical protein R1T42_01350 [Nonlabens ulvanivorans]